MVVSTTRVVVVSPMVAEVAQEATTSSKVAAARVAGSLLLVPSRPVFAHDMSMNRTTE